MANDKYKKNPGLPNARSPGSIQNNQHHDKSLSERDIAGSPGTVDRIISDSATLQDIPSKCVIRVLNTTGSTQFLFIGKEGDAPGGTPTISTGIAISPNFYENFYIGELADCASVHIKSSDNGVQVVVFEM